MVRVAGRRCADRRANATTVMEGSKTAATLAASAASVPSPAGSLASTMNAPSLARLAPPRSPRLVAVARVLPFALFIAVLALRGMVDTSASGSFDARWLYALQAGLAAAALVVFMRAYDELVVPPRGLFAWTTTVVVGVAIFALWVVPLPDWTRIGTPVANFVPVNEDGGLDLGLIAIRFFGAVLVVPLMEELFWRSYVMRSLEHRDVLAVDPRRVRVFAIVASSAVFALAHDAWFAGVVAGLAYAALYVRTGNLWFPIVAHALTNALLGVWVVQHRAWAYW